MEFPILPLPNKKLGDPSRSYSQFRGDNTFASFVGSGCDYSGGDKKVNPSDHWIDNVDAFPTNPCKEYPYTAEGHTFAPIDAIGGFINESIELFEFFDPHAFEPTPLSQNHLHSSSQQYRSSEVATNLMILKAHHQPTFTSYFLQPSLSTPLDKDQRYTKSDPVEDNQHSCHADLPFSNNNTTSDDVSNTTEDGSSESDQEAHTPRFRDYQKEQWVERFHELQEFHKKLGHAQVPNTMKENPPLARWVKRQRYQYRLRLDGKPSAMTQERITSLDNLGFIWDSRGSAWEDRLENLYEFKALHKHCNVPSNYPPKRSLASWVKCQRRQYKLFREEKQSNITADRINQLDKAGFQWELRSGKVCRW